MVVKKRLISVVDGGQETWRFLTKSRDPDKEQNVRYLSRNRLLLLAIVQRKLQSSVYTNEYYSSMSFSRIGGLLSFLSHLLSDYFFHFYVRSSSSQSRLFAE